MTSDQKASEAVMSDKVMSDELVTPHSSLVTAPASLRTAPAEFATVLEAALEWRGEQESGGAG